LFSSGVQYFLPRSTTFLGIASLNKDSELIHYRGLSYFAALTEWRESALSTAQVIMTAKLETLPSGKGGRQSLLPTESSEA
jgi:hypothetical protein